MLSFWDVHQAGIVPISIVVLHILLFLCRWVIYLCALIVVPCTQKSGFPFLKVVFLVLIVVT